jgi:glycosyltransferase involved in cell wall biosynthesis
MRVMHVNTARDWRGSERQTLLILEGLVSKGIRIALIAQPASPLYRAATEKKIPVHPIRMRGSYDLPAAYRLAKMAGKYGVEILHLQTQNAVGLAALAGLFGYRAKKVAARRVDSPVKSAWKYKRCDAVVAESGAVKYVLVRSGVREEKVRVIPSGVPTQLEKPADLQALRRQIGGDAKYLAGVIGHLTAHKGHRYLLEAVPRALAKEPNLKVAVVGSGELRRELESIAGKLGVAANVLFTGFIEGAQDLLWAFDLLVVPSVDEGQNTTLFEAMLRGVPIVATNVGGIPEVLDGGRYGMLVPPADPNALADAMVSALHDQSARRAMTEGAEQWVRERYSAEVMVDKTMDLYRELISDE